MGSIIVDIIIILIFIISCLVAYKRGFSAVVYHLASWIITIVLVFVLCKPITNIVIEKTNFDEFISDKIEINLEKTFKTNFEEGTLIEEQDSNISNSVINMINGYITEATENGVKDILQYVANEISYIVISAVVIIVLIILARVVSLLIKFVLEVIVSLPFIRSFNKIGGLAYGIFRAFIIIYIVLAILSLLSPILEDTGIISFIKSSNIGSIFYNENIILKYLS